MPSAFLINEKEIDIVNNFDFNIPFITNIRIGSEG